MVAPGWPCFRPPWLAGYPGRPCLCCFCLGAAPSPDADCAWGVACREISAAQTRLTDVLESLYAELPAQRELVRLAMSAVGRGGEGDVGQRIRDEILVVQQKNNAKGGMLEEWHQKLHNNTSPDDVVICQVRAAPGPATARVPQPRSGQQSATCGLER